MADMPIDEQRAAYVAALRSWIGTKFHDNAEVKGVGVDCARLVRMAAIETGLRDVEWLAHYSPQWFLHREGEQLLDVIRRYAHEIDASAAKPGDLVVYKIARAYAHVAVVTGPGTIVHAHKLSGGVVEGSDSQGDLRGREKRYFSPWAAHPSS